MIGVDLAKNAFQVHGAVRTEEVQFRKKLTRHQFPVFMARQPSSLVVFEASEGAHYWAHEMEARGQYVRPFVKRQKNDAADAEAIVIAACASWPPGQSSSNRARRSSVAGATGSSAHRGYERLAGAAV